VAEGARGGGAARDPRLPLDRATALLTELDGTAPLELQREAAEALTEAGLRAFAREANRTARQHFVRALELEPTTRRRYLGARAAVRLSDLPAVSREMEEVLAAAIQEGDGWTQGRALITLAEAAGNARGRRPRRRGDGRQRARRARAERLLRPLPGAAGAAGRSRGCAATSRRRSR
jgi:hypothetical protein